MDIPIEERLLLGIFLCSTTHQVILENLHPEWNGKVSASIREKYQLAGIGYPGKIFPFTSALSDSIDQEPFNLSHLIQPDLFLRLRPGKEKVVQQKLSAAGIPFQLPFPNTMALPNTTRVAEVIELNKEAIVQDYNSQLAGNMMDIAAPVRGTKAWDCCAASGGKSILLYDRYPGIDLTASDIRESILANLKKRFNEAGIKKYKSFVADLSSGKQPGFDEQFDIILADLPCSGSGTWSRTPEQLSFFDENRIEHYSSLQRKILENVWNYLKPGGHLLYITCSVFAAENEDNIRHFTGRDESIDLVKMEVLKGYDIKADSLFVTLLRKKS